jgi:hypothetical protein
MEIRVKKTGMRRDNEYVYKTWIQVNNAFMRSYKYVGCLTETELYKTYSYKLDHYRTVE